jgi:hypothetical protein
MSEKATKGFQPDGSQILTEGYKPQGSTEIPTQVPDLVSGVCPPTQSSPNQSSTGPQPVNPKTSE